MKYKQSGDWAERVVLRATECGHVMCDHPMMRSDGECQRAATFVMREQGYEHDIPLCSVHAAGMRPSRQQGQDGVWTGTRMLSLRRLTHRAEACRRRAGK